MIKDVFHIEKLAELLIKIKERPSMFLGKPSIELLKVFLSGYMLCKIETDIHAEFYPGFQTFIEQKYDRKGTEHHVEIIRSITTSDEQAFYKFFELLDEFQDKQGE